MRADLMSSGFNKASIVRFKHTNKPMGRKSMKAYENRVTQPISVIQYCLYRYRRHMIRGRRVYISHTVLFSSAHVFFNVSGCLGNTDAHSLHCCKASWSHFTLAWMWVQLRTHTYTLIHYTVRCMIFPAHKHMQG